jgi:hypothetical protein
MNKASGRILLVGEDSVLLHTRALLLSAWDTVAIHGSESHRLIAMGGFDLVILCQTLSCEKAEGIIRIAKAAIPPPRILAIRFPEDDCDLGVETYVTDMLIGPAGFRRYVVRMMDSTLVG